jgi:hypothetical protein
MSTGLKANSDGSAAIQVGGSDAIKIDTNLVSTGQFTSNIQPITATVAANALTITLSPTSLAFRSATLGDGTIYNRQITSAITLTISSGSTLGTVSAQQSRIVVLAIDNAGTIELAAVNIAGGNQLDETNLISTTAEGGAGAADSANVIYSTTARTNVAYRVVGFVQSTQSTAGTWATAPSTIQGVGGQALTAMSSLGYGQTWTDVLASRALATTYYNTTGKPISVLVSADNNVANGYMTAVVNGITIATSSQISTANYYMSPLTFIVPPAGTYSIVSGANTTTLRRWLELR